MENIQFVRFLTFIYWIQRIICRCPDTVHPGIKGFGPDCKYRCNCKDNEQCDVVTGECSNGCLFGWMGPGCQYRNLVTASIHTEQYYSAVDKTHWANRAIDGDVNTCSSTGSERLGDPTQQWWRLELSTEFYIVGLVIKIRDSYKANFQGFSVEIGNTTNNYEVCYQHRVGADREIVMNVNCVRPIIGKIVEIKLEENMAPPLVLCEVELFGGRLVSFNRLTSIETVLTYNGIWKASYAVDGRPMLSSSENQDNESKRTCSATMDYTSEPAKWWNVHLDTFYDIQGIRFFGRLDHGTSQYKSYKILVGNNSSQTNLIFTDNGFGDKQAYNPKSTNFTRPYLGSAVRVERSARILVICEFEVFAECPLGRCGWECNETCQCRSQTTGQHKIEGMCPYGCSGRWSGQNGKCNIECSNTTWGPYCNQACGQCKNNHLCSVSNGNCPDSCKPGFIPPLCLYVCDHGWYGMDCSKPCGSCKDGDTCNNTNGECTRGCNPGWLTSMCNIPCASGIYGDGCKETCGHCLNDEICSHENGLCLHGCASGYHGTVCKTECNDGEFGENCNSTCGQCQHDAACNKENGRCVSGCKPGYKLPFCIQTCDPGWYGAKCSTQCGSCKHGETCNNTNGECTSGCSPGWLTSMCNKLCEHGWYGMECSKPCGSCKDGDTCNNTNGECTRGCNPGWLTSMCNIPCASGFYGDGCKETCGHCLNDEICSHENGSCLHGCASGYQGTVCKTECNDGNFGEDCNSACGQCKNESVCNKETGRCVFGCKPGYKLPLCIQKCNDGNFGEDCNSTCGQCKNDSVCNKETGKCDFGCKPGYKLPLCIQKCEAGMYGENCVTKCGSCARNEHCNRTTGTCPHGCIPDYKGILCNVKATEGGSENGSSTGLGAIIVVLVLVIVGVFIGFIVRRKFNRDTRNSAANGSPKISDQNLTVINGPAKKTNVVPKPDQDPLYRNTDEKEPIDEKSIKISHLRTLSSSAKRDPTFLYSEFQKLPYGLTNDASEAKAVEYKPKNRYKDLYPYNMNRVTLPEIPGESTSTYINASYINGYETASKYIAAQGALETTVEDIWRMVWSKQISVIVMLTNCFELGRLKCVQYWSNEGSRVYADISTDVVSVEEYTDFKIRTFHCTQEESGERRTVLQFHYTAWPDKDVPDTALSLVQFWRKVRGHEKAKRLPWMVHCSAGVGRTGTFIALDYLYDQGKTEGKVNVKDGVYNLRQQRLNMVQTKKQYVYLHESVAETLDPLGTVCEKEHYIDVHRKLFTEEGIPNPTFYDEFENICEDMEAGTETAEAIYQNTADTNSANSKEHSDAMLPVNIPKSRDIQVIPDNLHRPRLGMTVKGRNDFINAVFVSTYRQKDRMILTQFPLRETVIDFVRMVWEFNIKTVVLLEDSDIAEGVYWPSSDVPKAIGPLKAELMHEKKEEFYISRTVRYSFRLNDNEQQKDVHMFHFRAWPGNEKIRKSTASMLRLISDIENEDTGKESSPLVIQCLDGAKKSGLLCVLLCVLERMKTDREVAIAETVRLVRLRRKQVIDNIEQYKYCYNIIREYIENHDVYANVM